jgi:flavin-dependent dehydrogenase
LNKVYDVCVIGGGPAGAALALRLAKLGRRTILIERDAFPRLHVGESLTGGTLPLLEVLGVRDEIENAGFLAAPRATVLWAGQLRLHETHGGYQVNRGIFDALLLNAARRAGVEVRQPALIIHSVHDNTRWTVTLRTGETIHARFLGDASGRSRFLPGARTPLGKTSLALYAYWSEVDAQDGGTIVEAAASHWYWAAPLPGGLFNATIIVDPSGNRLDCYLDLIRKSRLLGERLARGRWGEVSACTATPFLDESPISDRFIKVGDAALSIDPLSSQGVQTAIGTALHAAVVINTIIDHPERTDLAMKFYRGRLHTSSKFHAASAQTLYREQFAITATDFWRKRAAEALAREATAEKKHLQPEQYIRLAEGVSFVPVPTVDEHHVVVTEGVERKGKTNVFVAGVSIAALLKQVDRPMLARELLRRWKCILPAESAIQTLQWAWTEGWIE